MSPFQYQTFRNAGHLKYIYTALVIAGVLLPFVPTVINLGFGYGIMNFSPMICFLAVQDLGFYTSALIGVKAAILGTLQVLILLRLTKVCITTVSRCIAGLWFYVGLLCTCEKIYCAVIVVVIVVVFVFVLFTYI